MPTITDAPPNEAVPVVTGANEVVAAAGSVVVAVLATD